jgi:nitrite reductase/ring-hydroxylating ferredoxin subunit
VFNVNSGEVLEEPAKDSIATYEVRVEGDEIQVRTP